MPDTGLIVHHLNDSRSQRVLWLLEELGVPYTLKKWQRGPDNLAPKGLRDIHPLGKSPIIEDNGVVVAESGAIVDYVVTKYGSDKVSVNAQNRLDDVYWSHYAEGSIMPWMVQKIILTAVSTKTPFLLRPIFKFVCWVIDSKVVTPNLKRHANYIEAYLQEHADSMWFAHGDGPTSADYMMLMPMEGLTSGKSGIALGPKTRAWVEAVHARPAYQRVLEKGGEYAFAEVKA